MNKRDMPLKAGDLIRVNQAIPEYVNIRGKTVGVIIREVVEDVGTAFEILWPDSELESLYADELEHA